MNSPTRDSLARRLIGGALFLALIVVSMVVFLGVFAPKRPPERLPPYDGYDKAAMDAAMSPEAVGREFDGILGLGSRFLGHGSGGDGGSGVPPENRGPTHAAT